MTPVRFPHALAGASAALGAAAGINLVLFLAAGEALRIPGELSALHIVGFTLAAAPIAAVALRFLPRHFAWLAIVGALATAYAPYVEFGAPAGHWLAAMHIVAGVLAAALAPRIAAIVSLARHPGI